MKKNDKWIQYATQITAQIAAIFDEESENYIDPEELNDPQECTAFIHALLNAAPTAIYNSLIRDNTPMIDVNHLANKLCFQFSTREKGSEE